MDWIEQHKKGLAVFLILLCCGILSYCSYQKNQEEGREVEKAKKKAEEFIIEESLTENIRSGEEVIQKPEEKEGELKASEIRNLVEDEAPVMVEGERISVVESGLQFTGYEKVSALFWLSKEDWEKLQEEIVNFLKEKGLEGVTTVELLPDSIQTINQYEHYLYFSIDYGTEYADHYVLQARCDNYKEWPRYTFKMQYGD